MNSEVGSKLDQPGITINPKSISVLKIHNNAVKKKTRLTTFSSKEKFPSCLYSFFIKFLSSFTSSSSLNRILVRKSATAQRTRIEIGSAKSIQLLNEISGASGNRMFSIFTITRLGGVPIKVAIPPTEQEYANDRNKITVKL